MEHGFDNNEKPREENRDEKRDDKRDEKRDLFSRKVKAGRRTYFFDVKETHDGSKYLVITESKSTTMGYRRDRVMLFKEYLSDFTGAFQEVSDFLKSIEDGKASLE